MPTRTSELEITQTLLPLEDYAKSALPEISDPVAVPVGAGYVVVSLPRYELPADSKTVISVSLLLSQDNGRSFGEEGGFTTEGGLTYRTDIQTGAQTLSTHTKICKALPNPNSPSRLLRVQFTALEACRTQVNFEFMREGLK